MKKSVIRIGVFFCECRGEASKGLNWNDLIEYANRLPNVIMTKSFSDVCSSQASPRFREAIQKNFLNRVVIVGCSPRRYENYFKEEIARAGLHKHFLTMVNIREQCAWVHYAEPEAAQLKAKDMIKAGVEHSRALEKVPTETIGINKSALIVGAGVTGMAAAMDIANHGHKVYLIDKAPTIGGWSTRWAKLFPTDECSTCFSQFEMADVSNHPNIEVYTMAIAHCIFGL